MTEKSIIGKCPNPECGLWCYWRKEDDYGYIYCKYCLYQGPKVYCPWESGVKFKLAQGEARHLHNLISAGAWVDCNQSMPEAGVKVLIYTDSGEYVVGERYPAGDWEIQGLSGDISVGDICRITHWHYLSAPVKR